jgi:hypothetical protein
MAWFIYTRELFARDNEHLMGSVHNTPDPRPLNLAAISSVLEEIPNECATSDIQESMKAI